MDQQSPDRGVNDRHILLAALAAFALSLLALYGIQSGLPLPDRVKAGAKARMVTGMEQQLVRALATSIHGVVAGFDSGSVFFQKGANLPVKLVDEAAPVSAILLQDVGLWVATRATRSSPSSLVLVRDSHTPGPSLQSVALPSTGVTLDVTSLAGGLGRLWVGTTGGLFSYDWGHWAQHQPPARVTLPGGVTGVTALYLDVRGTLWIGTDRGLLAYNGTECYRYTGPRSRGESPSAEGALTTSADGLPGDVVTALSGDARGTIVCGTDKGLAILDREIWVRQAALVDPVTAVLVADDAVWVGTTRGLHTRVEGQWPEVTGSLGLTGEITALAFGPDGLYIGTGKGLHCWPLGGDRQSREPSGSPAAPSPRSMATPSAR